MRRTLVITPAVTLVTLFALLCAGCGPAHAPEGQPPLATITGGDSSAFQKAFNDTAENLRVIVLMSPT